MDEGQECFEIMLENATLYYQKEAGGFSSIIDTEGNDWIGFRLDSIKQYPLNAASEYRGLPNLVFRSDDSGAGHPGFSQCKSILISDNQIKTVTNSGKWEWTWTMKGRRPVLTDPSSSIGVLTKEDQIKVSLIITSITQNTIIGNGFILVMNRLTGYFIFYIYKQIN
jgi:hypothetical protein